MGQYVYTAPKALIKIGSKTAGYVRNLTFSENITRVNVQGLGSLLKKEVPPVAYDCQFTVDQFFLDFQQDVMQEMMHRLGSVQAIVDTLLLGELGFTIDLYQKTLVTQDGVTKMVTEADPTGETIAQLGPCYVNNQQFSVAEGGVAGYNVSGIYLLPISQENI